MGFKDTYDFYDEITFEVDQELKEQIVVTQGDTNSRGLIITLSNKGVPIPATTETMKIFAAKPDGTRLWDSARKEGTKFIIDFKNQMFSVPGKVLCVLVLYGTNGERVSGRTFKIDVNASIEETSLLSKNERGILDRALEVAATTVPRIENLDIEFLEDVIAGIQIRPEDFDLYMDESTRYLYLTVLGEPVSNGVLIPEGGSGTGGGPTTNAVLTVTNLTGWNYATFISGSKCEIKFDWASLENDFPTGSGVVKVFANRSPRLTKAISQGSVTLDITNYLVTGSNLISVQVHDAYGNIRTLSFNISVFAMKITSSFSTESPFVGPIVFSYIPSGEAEKTVHFLIDGVEVDTTITSANNREQTITIPKQTHGSHSLTVYFTATVDGQSVTSNVLFYDLIALDTGNDTPIIVSEFNTLNFKQWENAVVKYRVYTPNLTTSSVDLYLDGTKIDTRSVNRSLQTWNIKLTTSGLHTIKMVTGPTQKIFNITVDPMELSVQAETNALSLYLSSTGRNNGQSNKDVWSFGEYTAQFTNFNWISDGWVSDPEGNTALRVSGDARVLIPYKPFETDFRTYGKTIEIEFATRNVLDYDATILTSKNGGIGLEITAQRAHLTSEQVAITTQYKEDEHIRLSFVIEKKTNHQLVLCYINGILSRAIQYSTLDNFTQNSPVGITIGSNSCTTDIYNIRVYDNNLSRNQILDNWIADTHAGDVLIDRYDRNDIYDDYDNIVIDKLPSDLPYLILSAPVLPQYKGDKKIVSGQYVDPTDPSRNFTFDNAQANVQGTSSAGYARKNYKVSFKQGILQNGQIVDGFAIKKGDIPTDTFTFKADVASSEGANNTELVRIYNDTCPYKTPPQLVDPRVRQGIDGFPIVIFHDNGTRTDFVGKYNFNNDKGNLNVFGFTEGDESWEILNNTSNRVLFKSGDFSGTDWLQDFEGRQPEDFTDPTQLAPMVQWVVSTDQEQATNAELTSPKTWGEVTHTHDTPEYRLDKFKNEAKDWFEFDSLIFYYLFTELFLMSDSRAKNAFPSKFHNSKWCFLPYDMDTGLGTNNEGALVFDYHLEDIDQVFGADVFNGQNSTLWINVRQAFFNELKTMYQNLRSTNELSYSNVSSIFKNHQDVWSEAIFNEDAYFKYLEPLFENNETIYLQMVQGSKSEQRKWWLYNRFRYLDAKYNAGDSLVDFITLRGYAKSDITVTPYADIYASVKYGSYLVQKRALRGSSYTLECPLDNLNDTEIYIYSASQIKSVGDLSGLNVGLAEFAHANRLEFIKLGDPTTTNTNLHDLTVGNNALLRSIDLTNCINYAQPLDVSGCPNIENIYCSGTKITGLALPQGGRVKGLYLPGTLTNLTLVDLVDLTTFDVPSYANLNTLRLEGTPNVPLSTILSGSPNLARVRLLGVDLNTEDSSMLEHIATLGGIDENNNNIATPVVTGNWHITNILEQYLPIAQAMFPELVITYTNLIPDPTVTFTNWDGTILKTQVVPYGGNATPPSSPTRPKDGTYLYTFFAWDTPYENITANTTVTATYTSQAYFTVTFKNWNGTVLKSQDVISGGDATAPTDPSKNTGDGLAWIFTGWDKLFTNITQTTTVTATFVDDIPASWYVTASDSDFTWVSDTYYGYAHPSQTGKGYYNYTGTGEYVSIPDAIGGYPLTNAYRLFRMPPSTLKGVKVPSSLQLTSTFTMFNSCKIKYFDFSEFDTSTVTNMSQMFSHAGVSGAKIDLSSFDTSNVTNMSSMFSVCEAASLDLSSFNTSKVTTMSGMFYSSAATSLDLSSFDTSNVTDMSNMFYISKATSLDLSSFNTSKVTDMSRMFSTSKATSLDLSSFNTSKVATMSRMFYSSPASELDLSSFDTSNVTDMSYMFNECNASVIDLSSFNTSSVTSMGHMFYKCRASELDLSSFNTSNVTDMNSMFYYCYAAAIDVRSFDVSKVTTMYSLFSNSQIKLLDLSTWNIPTTGIMLTYAISSMSRLKLVYVDSSDTATRLSGTSSVTAPLIVKTVPTHHYDLSGAEINQILTDLPTITTTKTLDFKDSAGVASCDPSIGTAKGWTIITS